MLSDKCCLTDCKDAAAGPGRERRVKHPGASSCAGCQGAQDPGAQRRRVTQARESGQVSSRGTRGSSSPLGTCSPRGLSNALETAATGREHAVAADSRSVSCLRCCCKVGAGAGPRASSNFLTPSSSSSPPRSTISEGVNLFISSLSAGLGILCRLYATGSRNRLPARTAPPRSSAHRLESLKREQARAREIRRLALALDCIRACN